MKGRERSDWISWDFALTDALQTIEDFTDQHGLLAWKLADERVEIEAVKKIHKFEAARDRATTSPKGYKPVPGEYFVPEEVWLGSEDTRPWTYREWVNSSVNQS